jgi:hypothetical protein
MSRRLVAVLAVLGLVPALPAAAAPRTQPLLPLARGQVDVSLGTPPEWRPESGRPLTLTLFAGRPAASSAAARRDNGYVALQPVARGCARSAAADGIRPLHVIRALYSGGRLISVRGSLFAPAGGAAPGDYEADLPGVVVRQHGAVRVCVWIARSPRRGGLAGRQDLPLLDGLFAASVAVLPGGPAREYSLSAVDVGREFRYTTVTHACGRTTTEAPLGVEDGGLGAESVSYSARACPGDGSVFSFTSGGRSLGSLTYTVQQAAAAPPAIAALGGCELGPVDGAPPEFAIRYVQAAGCTVARVLTQPYSPDVPRGHVVEAQVDGGVAEVAPSATAVDLVVNGRGA